MLQTCGIASKVTLNMNERSVQFAGWKGRNGIIINQKNYGEY